MDDTDTEDSDADRNNNRNNTGIGQSPFSRGPLDYAFFVPYPYIWNKEPSIEASSDTENPERKWRLI